MSHMRNISSGNIAAAYLTNLEERGIMVDATRESPWLEFDRDTGQLYLTDGRCRRVIARVNDGGEILIWWRTPEEKREHRLKVEDIFKALMQ